MARKLKQDPSIAEWHGAPNHIRRIIDGLIASADETYADAMATPSVTLLVEYMVSVSTIFKNAAPAIDSEQRRKLSNYLDRIQSLRWRLKSEMTKKDYFTVLNAVSWLDSQLRQKLQEKRLLFKIGVDKQKATPQSVKDTQRYVSEEDKQELMSQFPALRDYYEDDGSYDGPVNEAAQGEADISDEDIEADNPEEEGGEA